MVGLARCDVRPRVDESCDAVGLGVRQRPVARAALDVSWLPVTWPVAVHVVAAGAILVDLAVAVVVEAFLAGNRPFAAADRSVRAGRGRHWFHLVRIELAAAVRAVRIATPHHANRAIAIEVVGAILVGPAVAVVVGRLHARARRVRRVLRLEPGLPAVWIGAGDEVERDSVDQRRERVVLRVLLDEVPDGVEDRLRCLTLVAVDVAVDVYRGLRGVGPRLRAVEREHEDRAALRTRSDLRVGEELGVRGRERLSFGLQRWEISEVVEAERGLRLGALLRLRDGRSEERRGKHDG